MKIKIIGFLVCILLIATALPVAGTVNKITSQPASTSADVPTWEVGDSWTYNEKYVNRVYKADGTIWYLWYHNCTSTYNVTDITAENYTLTMTSTNNEGSVTIGSFHFKFSKYIKFSGEMIFKKTDLSLVSRSAQEKGLVFLLLFNIIPIPMQYTDVWAGTFSPTVRYLPFPLTAGTNGTLPNASYTGYEKCSLFWGLITMYNWPNLYGYTGEQNYTCEMANITVPMGTYDTYNVSVTSTSGMYHALEFYYYAPEVGWMVKEVSNDTDVGGRPGSSFESELVSFSYTP